jgi:hypothetical protein
MMIDMCVVYGRANNDLVSKMLANLFKQQPAYVKTSHFFLLLSLSFVGTRTLLAFDFFDHFSDQLLLLVSINNAPVIVFIVLINFCCRYSTDLDATLATTVGIFTRVVDSCRGSGGARPNTAGEEAPHPEDIAGYVYT